MRVHSSPQTDPPQHHQQMRSKYSLASLMASSAHGNGNVTPLSASATFSSTASLFSPSAASIYNSSAATLPTSNSIATGTSPSSTTTSTSRFRSSAAQQALASAAEMELQRQQQQQATTGKHARDGEVMDDEEKMSEVELLYAMKKQLGLEFNSNSGDVITSTIISRKALPAKEKQRSERSRPPSSFVVSSSSTTATPTPATAPTSFAFSTATTTHGGDTILEEDLPSSSSSSSITHSFMLPATIPEVVTPSIKSHSNSSTTTNGRTTPSISSAAPPTNSSSFSSNNNNNKFQSIFFPAPILPVSSTTTSSHHANNTAAGTVTTKSSPSTQFNSTSTNGRAPSRGSISKRAGSRLGTFSSSPITSTTLLPFEPSIGLSTFRHASLIQSLHTLSEASSDPTSALHHHLQSSQVSDSLDRQLQHETNSLLQATTIATELTRNEMTTDHRSLQTRVKQTEHTLQETSFQARVKAEQEWKQQKEQVDTEYEQQVNALNTRLYEISQNMQLASSAMWVEAKERREEREVRDIEVLQQQDRQKEIEQLEEKLVDNDQKAKERWQREWLLAREEKLRLALLSEALLTKQRFEYSQIKQFEYEKKRAHARCGVLWIKIKSAEGLGEENWNHPPGGGGGGAGHRKNLSSTDSSSTTGGATSSSSSSPSTTILPRYTSTCISVQLRFKAASLSSQIRYTRYFHRLTNPEISESFKLDVSNAYLQTVCIVVQTSPLKQVECWERDVRAAIGQANAAVMSESKDGGGSIGAAAAGGQQIQFWSGTDYLYGSNNNNHAHAHARISGGSSNSVTHGDLIRAGVLTVKHPIMKEPSTALLTPILVTEEEEMKSASMIYLQEEGPSGTSTVGTSEKSSAPETPRAIGVSHHLKTLSTDQLSSSFSIMSPTAAAAVVHENTQKLRRQQQHAAAVAAAQAAAAEEADAKGTSSSADVDLTPSLHDVASLGLGANQLFLPLSSSTLLLPRLRARDEVITRIDEIGRAEIPLAVIRATQGGRMRRSLKMVRMVTETQRKEREQRKMEARKGGSLSLASTAGSKAGPVSTTTSSTSSIPSLPLIPRVSNILNGNNSSKSSPTMLSHHLTSTAATAATHNNNDQRTEPIESGHVQVELILLPLFSRASHHLARDNSSQHDRILLQNGSGGSGKMTEAQLANLEAQLERDAEEAANREYMPKWIDPTPHTTSAMQR